MTAQFDDRCAGATLSELLRIRPQDRAAGCQAMKVLVIGSGAREHAITWALAASRHCPDLLIAPGNAGTAELGCNVDIDAEDVDHLLEFSIDSGVDLTIVGPEVPLALGIVDRFSDAGLSIFGPTKAAARIESSKAFAKQVMMAAGVPTGSAHVFTDLESATLHVVAHNPPYVIKADGLAAGKGVIIAEDHDQAVNALRSMFIDRTFGPAGETVLIEEWLSGREISVFAFLSGKYVSELVVACDYKRIFDGDLGPNTGGMGSYSPPPFWDAQLEQAVRLQIVQPVADQLVELGCPFTGVLYGGIMLTKEGPKVFEFNCRLGDPETQVVLPRLESDLLDIVVAAVEGRLADCPVKWSPDPWVGVVMASEGYPGTYDTGVDVTGIPSNSDDRVVFHAGTQRRGARTITSGGRVLTVAARGQTLADARRGAYQLAHEIEFANAYYRRDIAASI